MGIYQRWIFPHLIDFGDGGRSPGRTPEDYRGGKRPRVGDGSGLNLPLYRSAVGIVAERRTR
jgi:hypothetical protein